MWTKENNVNQKMYNYIVGTYIVELMKVEFV